MIKRLDHGMYWHIPRSGSILRMDKKAQQLIIVKGNFKDPELRALSRELKKIGYGLIERVDETGYYTC